MNMHRILCIDRTGCGCACLEKNLVRRAFCVGETATLIRDSAAAYCGMALGAIVVRGDARFAIAVSASSR